MKGNVRLMSENYVDLALLANTDVSSQQSAFPVTNAYNSQRRSKVWRSNGHFKIIAGENTIIFRDASGGPDKTATIAPGEYSSTTSFMNAVDAAFEASGLASYAVTQNSNLKFAITSDLSGGATHFEINWSDSDSLAMAAVMGYDISGNDTGGTTYTSDVSRVATSEWIKWDMGISSDPNAFILAGPRNKPIKISPSATITLQASHFDNWTSPPFELVIPYDDEVIAVLAEESLSNTAYRYWRLKIEDLDNPNGYVEVGCFFLGRYYVPERGKAQYPFGSNSIDRSDSVTSEGGQLFHNIQEQTRSFSFDWKGLTKEEMEEFQQIFLRYGKSKPLFVSMDTVAAYSSAFQRKLKFVKFSDEPKETLVSVNNYSMTTQFREEL